jgi:hypothetical protein
MKLERKKNLLKKRDKLLSNYILLYYLFCAEFIWFQFKKNENYNYSCMA